MRSAALALALAAAPTLANASIVELRRAGAWSVSGGTRPDGQSVCTITSTVYQRPDATVSLEHVGRDIFTSIILAKPTWQISDPTTTTVAFVFNYDRPIVKAVLGRGTRLVALLDAAETAAFLSKLEFNSLRVDFKGDEPPWGLLIANFYLNKLAFLDCLKGQRPAAPPRVTQPF